MRAETPEQTESGGATATCGATAGSDRGRRSSYLIVGLLAVVVAIGFLVHGSFHRAEPGTSDKPGPVAGALR